MMIMYPTHLHNIYSEPALFQNSTRDGNSDLGKPPS